MSKLIAIAGLSGALLATGCTTGDASRSTHVRRCSAEGTAWAIGQVADEANGRRLFQQSGAGLWRIISPERTARADRRDDRLTVHVDTANRITAIECI